MSTRPILLLHGALGSAEQLAPFKDALAEHFEVHTLNFTGHGGRAWSEAPFSMALFTQDVLDYLDANNLTQVHIIGYSMGGYVGLRLAQKHPERVGKIWTIATKFEWSPAIAAKEIQHLDPDVIAEKVPAFAETLKQRHAPQDWRQHLAKTAALMVDLGNGDAFGEGDLAGIAHKVWVTVGTKDRMVSQAESQRAAQWLGQATFEALEGLPHPIERMDVQLLSQQAVAYFKD